MVTKLGSGKRNLETVADKVIPIHLHKKECFSDNNNIPFTVMKEAIIICTDTEESERNMYSKIVERKFYFWDKHLCGNCGQILFKMIFIIIFSSLQ